MEHRTSVETRNPTDADRAAFIAGYEAALEEIAELDRGFPTLEVLGELARRIHASMRREYAEAAYRRRIS
jgi:hypothetical protein